MIQIVSRRFSVMAKKKNHFHFVLIAFLFLGACAWGGSQGHIGQNLEPEDRRALDTATGEHVTRTNTFIMHETYRIDQAASQVHLSGKLNYTFDTSVHWLGATTNRMWIDTIYVQALFADRSGEVIAIEPFRIYPREPIFSPVSFEQTLPLPPESAFMTLRLTTYFLDGATQMISRQISATQTEETGGIDGGSFSFRRDPAVGRS
jgi:hypothetical protein